MSCPKLTKIFIIFTALALIAGFTDVASAACDPSQQSCSSNYGVSETFFGNGGELNACSTNYCAKQSAGETGVGNTSSSNYQAQAGFNTDRTPYLQFTVNNTNTDLGTLTPGTTAYTTATFSVKSYLADSYDVVTASNPPTNGAYTMKTLTTAATSDSTKEQFGINLVANTTACGAPASFGAGPAQVPDSSFSFGTAASGYDTCGEFQYNKGDIIAQSSKSSGETDYTISYIFNVTNVTPGGTYDFHQVLVATSTF